MGTILNMILVLVILSTVLTMSAQKDYIKKYGFDWDYWSTYWFCTFIASLAVVLVLGLILVILSIFDQYDTGYREYSFHLNNETRSRYDKEYQRKQSSSRSQDIEYKYQDADLEQDIHNAQKKAADTVQEFINDFKKRGSRAKSAAWQEAKKQGIVLVQIFVFFALVSIILRACS